eukprot:c636_g1_i1.p1 GENE.c636_g1_i1~~c636_g1_i1.p1  ORF type:complete len:450 (+),score=117.73 c636_g1_i1:42-1352(+)
MPPPARHLVLPKDQVTACCDALIKHLHNQQALSKKAALFDSCETFNLLVQFDKIPPEVNSNKPISILLKHDYLPEDGDVCLITKDPVEYYKNFAQRSPGLSRRVTSIIGHKELKNSYKEFEAKRKLCNSYSLFLADHRIISQLPGFLGKVFFEKKKLPVSVKLPQTENQSFVSPVNAAIKRTYVTLREGSCCLIKIGHSKMDIEHLVENIIDAVDTLIQKIPRSVGVQTISLKTPESLALPVYSKLPNAPLKIVVDHTKKRTREESVDTDDQPKVEEPQKKKQKASPKKPAAKPATKQPTPQTKVTPKPSPAKAAAQKVVAAKPTAAAAKPAAAKPAAKQSTKPQTKTVANVKAANAVTKAKSQPAAQQSPNKPNAAPAKPKAAASPKAKAASPKAASSPKAVAKPKAAASPKAAAPKPKAAIAKPKPANKSPAKK